MVKARGRALTALGLAAALAFVGAGTAHAASKSGAFNCSGSPLSGYIYSSTSGKTVHSHQNRSTGSVKVVTWASGGSHTSYGYQNEAWVVSATSISSAGGTCR